MLRAESRSKLRMFVLGASANEAAPCRGRQSGSLLLEQQQAMQQLLQQQFTGLVVL
jgi:hypothetical protein